MLFKRNALKLLYLTLTRENIKMPTHFTNINAIDGMIQTKQEKTILSHFNEELLTLIITIEIVV